LTIPLLSESLLVKNDAQVGVAALIGTATAPLSLFLENLEPLFRVLVQFGQVAVAVVTVIYIIAKIKAVRRSKKDDEKS
jgi:hypothetical protein